jgi:hypothetical protein
MYRVECFVRNIIFDRHSLFKIFARATVKLKTVIVSVKPVESRVKPIEGCVKPIEGCVKPIEGLNGGSQPETVIASVT